MLTELQIAATAAYHWWAECFIARAEHRQVWLIATHAPMRTEVGHEYP